MSNYTELISFFNDKINVAFTSINNKTQIIDDTNKCAQIINADINQIATPIQKHTNIVKWTDSAGLFENCDGIATNTRYNLILSLSVADCTPVCMFDPVCENYALVHSGWKGTYKKISNNALQIIIKQGSKLNDIQVYLGPSISQTNYEVDEDVASFFSIDSYISSGKKYLLDIKSQIKSDIIDAGVKPKNIYCSNRCTYDELNLCSFRRDGERTGRMIFLMGKFSGRN